MFISSPVLNKPFSAFKLVANGNATQNQSEVFNNWFVDFAKKQGADGETADKVSTLLKSKIRSKEDLEYSRRLQKTSS